MFVASHKPQHLKGLSSQGGPLRLQDVLALVEGACVMVVAAILSSSFMLKVAPSHVGIYLQLHGLFKGNDVVQVI